MPGLSWQPIEFNRWPKARHPDVIMYIMEYNGRGAGQGSHTPNFQP